MTGGRRAAAVLLFFGALPLQWQVLADTPVGVLRWFHLGTAVLLLLAPPPRAAFRDVVAVARGIPAALCVLTLLLVAAAGVHGGDPWQPVQQLVHAAAGLAVAAALLAALRDDRSRRLLVWAAPLALVSFLVAFGLSLAAAGAGPVEVIGPFVRGRVNGIVYGVFERGFSAGGALVEANRRHEVMVALLAAASVTLSAGGRRAPVVASGAAGLCVLLSVFSLSRSVLLALVLTAGLGCARAQRRLRPSLRASAARATASWRTAATALVVVATVVLLLGRFALLLVERLDQKDTYQVRLRALAEIDEVSSRLFVGGRPLATSTHTFVLDSALTGSWLAGAAALAVVARVLVLTARHAAAFVDTGGRTSFAAAAVGGLVIVRTVTGGGGELHQASWTALAVLLALTASMPSRGRISAALRWPLRLPTSTDDAAGARRRRAGAGAPARRGA